MKGKEEIKGVGRCSKDKKVNRKRRILIRKLEETRWSILNEEVDGDELGEFTYSGSRERYIKYMLANRLKLNRLKTNLEEKGILPDEQTSFRKKMHSIDNVCFKFSGK